MDAPCCKCEKPQMTALVTRTLFAFAVATVVFFALVPGPLGQIIESGEQRHVLAFALLPIISALGWPAIGARMQWLGYAIFGASIEVTQGWMAVGRQAELGDWLVDMAAATISLTIVHLIRRTRTPVSA